MGHLVTVRLNQGKITYEYGPKLRNYISMEFSGARKNLKRGRLFLDENSWQHKTR